ncbi:unnamed protein product [Enterobius vermicularis]|uniref:Ectonucleotide pyrophosphatase/phosphodiesterase family member 6 n=1 Tax=Enterobius vermicularis TaxID=51028 RepID=A0A0N4UUA2_ENTVE|nr:unnamed protein product [Enterobius vermicularis]
MLLTDAVINYLTTRLVEEGIMGCINMIILSDHGMESLNHSRSVIMTQYISQTINHTVFSGVVGRVYVLDNASVDTAMATMKCKNGTDYLIHKRKEYALPVRYHYGGSARVGDAVVEGRATVFIMKFVFVYLIAAVSIIYFISFTISDNK